ncbi:MAG: Ig-like domain-containing protein [Gemmatimonadales bacterium]
MPTFRNACRLAPTVALVLACGGADLVLPDSGEPAAVEILRGTPQSGRVGVALTQDVVARVTDSQDGPLAGVRVALVFTDAGSGATSVPDTAATDADGRASFEVVLGDRVGAVSAELRVSTAGGQRTLTAPLAFTAVSADANELLLASGDSQSAPVGAPLPQPLVVQVTDAFGNPIAGVPIGWTVEGGGSVDDAATLTGPDGFASVERVLGPDAGTQRTIANAPGLAGSPLTFVHTARAGDAAVLEQVSGDGQSALVGTSLPAPLVVRVRDGAGNPVPGLAVTWLVGNGGGQLTPATSRTDADGLAGTTWTMGGTPQLDTATAVVSGVGTVAFSATASPGTPPSLALETQPPGTAVRGVGLSRRPVVGLREPDGSRRQQAGVTVTVALVGAGGTLRGTLSRATGSDGRVEFGDLALEGSPGSYALAFAAADYAGVTSSPVALQRAPTTTSVLSDDPDPSEPGGTVRVRFRIESPGGTPVGTVRVTSDDGASCTGTVAGGECTLTLATAGTRTLTAAFTGSTEFVESRDTEDHVVEAAASPVLAMRTQPSASAVQGVPFGRQPVVQLRDGQGGELKTGGVTVTAAIATGGGTLGGSTSASTDANGQAAFADLFIGGAAGAHTLRFTATGYTEVVSDPIDVAPAPATPSASLSTVAVADASIALGARTDVTVTVRDASGAALADIVVTLAASGAGNTIDPAQRTSDRNGVARFTFSASEAGTQTLTAQAGGVTIAQQPTVAVAQAASATRITSDDPDPSEPGGTVTVRFTVTSAAGTPAGDVAVTASSGGGCTGTVEQGSCSLALTGAGSVSLTATYAGNASFAGSADTETHTVAAPSLAIRSQPSKDARPGQPLRKQPEIELRGADGGELKRAGVTVAASLASGPGSLGGSTTAVTDDRGRARFDDLVLTGDPGTYTLGFAADGFGSVTSDGIELRRTATSTSIRSDQPDPSTVGEPVTVEFQVTSGDGTPGGAVTVAAGIGEACTASVADGRCILTLLLPGARTLTASYAGDEGFEPSAGTATHQVQVLNQPPTATADAFDGTEDVTLVESAPGVLANDSDPDGGTLHAALESGPAHGQVALADDGGFSYTPDPDFAGTDAFTYLASDGVLASTPTVVQLTIAAVNDPPAFIAGTDPVAPADGGAQVLPGWASAISPGPVDEGGQTVTFVVQVVEGAELFAAPPTITAEGTLTFTPAGATGTAQVTVTAKDDGGLASGGSDTGAPHPVSITFTPPAQGV